MYQALHIFKKDLGLLRYHITLTLVAAGALCVTGAMRANGAGPATFILPVTWWFLIAAVVHAEPLPGRGHFWLTRPYRRKSLLCAKALFIVTFVNAPILIADIVIVHAAGFSITANIDSFIWTQVLLLAAFEIPAAAIASITSGLLELLIATLFLIFVALAWFLLAPMTRLGSSWMNLGWIVDYFLFGQIAIIGAIILLCQYFYRATLASRMAAALTPILLFASGSLLPWTTAFQIQTRFSKRSIDTSSLHVHLDSERKWAGRVYLDENQRVVTDVPIQLTGLPNGAEFRPYGVAVTLIAPDNEAVALKTAPPHSFEYDSGSMSLRLALDKTLYEKFKREPLKARGIIYFSLYEKHQSAPIPFNNQRTHIDGVGSCEASSRFLLCRSAFRPPPSSVAVELTQQSPTGPVRSTEQLSGLGYSSPFPAEFNVDPIFQLSSPRLAPISDVVVKASEPIAYAQKEFAIDQLVLADFPFRN